MASSRAMQLHHSGQWSCQSPWDKRQLSHRVHQVRGGGFRLVLPCHPWQVGTSQIHGHAPLCLPATQDARQDRSTHTAWRPEEVILLRPRGDQVRHSSRVPEPSAEVLMWQNQPELYRLKYASPFHRAPTYFKRYNPLACRVKSR
jgi:hypothetical protein